LQKSHGRFLSPQVVKELSLVLSFDPPGGKKVRKRAAPHSKQRLRYKVKLRGDVHLYGVAATYGYSILH